LFVEMWDWKCEGSGDKKVKSSSCTRFGIRFSPIAYQCADQGPTGAVLFKRYDVLSFCLS